MNKIIYVFILIASFFCADLNVNATVPAEPNSYQIFQFDEIMEGAHYEYFTPTGENAIFGVTEDLVGHLWTLGEGLVLDDEEMILYVDGLPISNVTGLSSSLSDLADDVSDIEIALSNSAITTGSYSNPSWITAIAASKITGLATVATTGNYSDLSGKPTIPTNNNQLTNGSGFLTAEVDGSVSNEIELPTQTGNSGKVLSTNGTSPSWFTPSVGTVTSVGMTSSDLTVSGSPVTASGLITANLAASGVSVGTYDSVTVNAKGIVTAATNRSQSVASRSLNTCFQVSSTKDSFVNYSVEISSSLSLTTGQTGTVFLEIYSDSGCTTGTQEIARSVNGNTGTLAIGLNITQNVTAGINGFVPKSCYVKIRTSNTVGTPSFVYKSGQEVLV